MELEALKKANIYICEIGPLVLFYSVLMWKLYRQETEDKYR